MHGINFNGFTGSASFNDKGSWTVTGGVTFGKNWTFSIHGADYFNLNNYLSASGLKALGANAPGYILEQAGIIHSFKVTGGFQGVWNE